MMRYKTQGDGDPPTWFVVVVIGLVMTFLVIAANYGVARSIELRCERAWNCND